MSIFVVPTRVLAVFRYFTISDLLFKCIFFLQIKFELFSLFFVLSSYALDDRNPYLINEVKTWP